ncbi:hypothetical protein O181_039379 [Austropuccinia psidii MF-1]|uniref:SUZ domain-containing protein n=1 Tax=Austropuccinia psidii MF-1 TaxID=1389203 RepID=A0A9Q3DAC1_9BASI|nr:hypothetical protein [Austropuccinia psidii MF-1]
MNQELFRKMEAVKWTLFNMLCDIIKLNSTPKVLSSCSQGPAVRGAVRTRRSASSAGNSAIGSWNRIDGVISAIIQLDMPSKTASRKEEPCDDWEDESYDDDGTDLASRDVEPVPQEKQESQPKLAAADSNSVEAQNCTLWKNANSNPQYIIIPSNAAHSATSASRPLPQNAMFGKSPITILQRPKQNSSATSSVSARSSPTPDFPSREKAYGQARARIFGPKNETDYQPEKLNPQLPHLICPVSIERHPSGPTEINEKGFQSRRKQSGRQEDVVLVD